MEDPTGSNMEKLVRDAVSKLHEKDSDYAEKDDRYLSEHGLQKVQVNINNIRNHTDWISEEDHFVKDFKLKVGSREKWEQILNEGLTFAKNKGLLSKDKDLPSPKDDKVSFSAMHSSLMDNSD